MGLEAALERPGSVLGTLVIAEDEVEVVGRLSFPTACSSASATGFSVMRPSIDRPTTFLRNASITAARQGHPSPVPMQAMSPTHSLLRASTSNALSTRLARGSPIPTAFARLRFPLAPFACSPSLRMTASTRFSLTTMPPRLSSRLIRRCP